MRIDKLCLIKHSTNCEPWHTFSKLPRKTFKDFFLRKFAVKKANAESMLLAVLTVALVLTNVRCRHLSAMTSKTFVTSMTLTSYFDISAKVSNNDNNNDSSSYKYIAFLR